MGQSPRLGPMGMSPGGSRARSDSMHSLGSPLMTPNSTGMTPLLTNMSVSGGDRVSPPAILLDAQQTNSMHAPAPESYYQTQQPAAQTHYHASFRSPQEGPQTGLGILMSTNGSSAPDTSSAIGSSHTLFHQHHATSLAGVTPEQLKQMQRDAQDRDSQARALAAAGMAAEQMSGSYHHPPSGQGLHPPPSLGNPTSAAHPSTYGVAASSNHIAAPVTQASSNDNPNQSAVDSNDPNDPSMTWNNLDIDGQNPTLQEMEMDFAKLFDPELEWESMQTEGSGWPMSSNAEAPSPLPGAVDSTQKLS